MAHDEHSESHTQPVQTQKQDADGLRERIALRDWLESLEKSGWLRLGETVDIRLPRPIEENDPHE